MTNLPWVVVDRDDETKVRAAFDYKSDAEKYAGRNYGIVKDARIIELEGRVKILDAEVNLDGELIATVLKRQDNFVQNEYYKVTFVPVDAPADTEK